jgi:hypothetical protein
MIIPNALAGNPKQWTMMTFHTVVQHVALHSGNSNIGLLWLNRSNFDDLDLT